MMMGSAASSKCRGSCKEEEEEEEEEEERLLRLWLMRLHAHPTGIKLVASLRSVVSSPSHSRHRYRLHG